MKFNIYDKKSQRLVIGIVAGVLILAMVLALAQSLLGF
jgi:hypothetical protein